MTCCATSLTRPSLHFAISPTPNVCVFAVRGARRNGWLPRFNVLSWPWPPWCSLGQGRRRSRGDIQPPSSLSRRRTPENPAFSSRCRRPYSRRRVWTVPCVRASYSCPKTFARLCVRPTSIVPQRTEMWHTPSSQRSFLNWEVCPCPILGETPMLFLPLGRPRGVLRPPHSCPVVLCDFPAPQGSRGLTQTRGI